MLMFGYEQANPYPQKALMNCLARAPAHQKLRWLENKDVLTRDTMLTHVNRQIPAGEALRLALDEHRTDWQSPTLSTLSGFDSRYLDCRDDYERPPKGSEKGKGRQASRQPGQPGPRRGRALAGAAQRSRSRATDLCRFYNKGTCRHNSGSCPRDSTFAGSSSMGGNVGATILPPTRRNARHSTPVDSMDARCPLPAGVSVQG